MMKKKLYGFYLLSILILASVFSAQTASAKTVIADPANTLSIDELEQITSYCDTINDHFDASIYITITKEMGAKDNYQKYMDKIGKDNNSPKKLVFLFVGLKESTPIVHITSYGTIQDKMTQKRCDRIASHIEGDIEDGDYYEALDSFTDTVHEYLGKSPTLDRIFFRVLPHILLSIVLGILLLYLMLHFRAPDTKSPLKTYLNTKQSKLYGRLDHFAGTKEVRVKKKTFKEAIKAICDKIAALFMPLWDKAYEHLDPYIATYQKKRRDKKREKEKTKNAGRRKTKKKGKNDDNDEDNTDEFEYVDGMLKSRSRTVETPSDRNTSEKANVVSKDLINEVAKMNSKEK